MDVAGFTCNNCDAAVSEPNAYASPSVVQMASSLEGFATYRLVVSLQGDASSVYAIMGTTTAPLELPPAYQTAGPAGANIGGVDPELLQLQPDAAFDSWLTNSSCTLRKIG